MKAIQYQRYGGPEVLEQVDLPDPRPGPGQVLVAVEAASLVPADWKVRAGHLKEFFAIEFPKVPGRDGAGTVVELGAGVDYAAVGDGVCFVTRHEGSGSHAARVVGDAGNMVPKPAALSFVESAALMHAGICAWNGLVRVGRVTGGMKVLVHGGAGAIGGMAVQLAASLGAEVAATCRAANVDFVRDLGASVVIPYDREDFAALLEDYDLVYDLVGGEVHARSYRVLKRGGALVYLIAAPIEDRSAEFGVTVTRADIHEDAAVLREVVRLADAGAWRPLVSETLPLADAAEAHRRFEGGEVTRGRLVLVP